MGQSCPQLIERIKKMKTAKTVTPAKLDTIRTTAFNSETSQLDAIAAIKAAWSAKSAPIQKQVRDAYVIGRMAASLMTKAELAAGDNERTSAMIERFEQATAALAKSGHTSKGKAVARRTKAEETAYTAARTAFGRVLKAAGCETIDNRGGADNAKKRKPSGAKPGSNKTDKAAVLEPVLPIATNAPEVTLHLLAVAKQLGKYHQKNAKAFEVWQSALVNDFIKAINAGKPEARPLKNAAE